MRGRKPTPPAVKALKAGVAPPRVNCEPPDCPEWLDDNARTEWNRIAPELASLGLLARVDTATLASYCIAWGKIHECQEVLAREGMMTTGSRDQPRIHPAAQQMDAWMRQVKVFITELGLSPVARMRIQVPEPNEERDQFDSF